MSTTVIKDLDEADTSALRALTIEEMASVTGGLYVSEKPYELIGEVIRFTADVFGLKT
jgi:hypothetical protein